jgi:lysophospholipase L1-like esterase
MKNKVLLLLIALVSVFGSCKESTKNDRQVENPMGKSVEIKNNTVIKIACVGNSITEGAGIAEPSKNAYPAQLQHRLGSEYEVKNFGVGGRTLLRKGDFPYWEETTFQDAKDYQPDVVVILLGTNDSKPQNWQYSQEFVKDYKIFIDEFQTLNSRPEIFICKPLPSFPHDGQINGKVIKNEIHPMIETIASSKEIEIIDLYTPFEDKRILLPDAVHPNKEGAGLIAEQVKTHILKWIDSQN